MICGKERSFRRSASEAVLGQYLCNVRVNPRGTALSFVDSTLVSVSAEGT